MHGSVGFGVIDVMAYHIGVGIHVWPTTDMI